MTESIKGSIFVFSYFSANLNNLLTFQQNAKITSTPRTILHYDEECHQPTREMDCFF